MVSKSFWKWMALGLIGAAVPIAGASAQSAAPAAQEKAPEEAATTAAVVTELLQRAIPLEVTLQGAPEAVLAIIDDEKQEHVKASEYWIGIALGELPAVAKKQLKLEHGLVIEDVMPDSPAAKAEFQQLDVLVLVGDKPVNEPMDVVTAVEEAKEKELRVVIFRDGKEMAVKVTPVKRPKPATAEAAIAEAVNPEAIQKVTIKKIEDALLELKGHTGEEHLGLFLARPGVVASGGAWHHAAELPKNLTISITRGGDGPAKIHVKREGKEWSTTSDKLMELPEDVRSHVEQMLSKVIHPMLSAKARSLVVPRIAHETTRVRIPDLAPPAVAVPRTTTVRPVPPTPATPAVPAAPPAATQFRAFRVEGGGTDGKLDLILKKLEALDSKSIEQLQEEVKRLRKELDELRNK